MKGKKLDREIRIKWRKSEYKDRRKREKAELINSEAQIKFVFQRFVSMENKLRSQIVCQLREPSQHWLQFNTELLLSSGVN